MNYKLIGRCCDLILLDQAFSPTGHEQRSGLLDAAVTRSSWTRRSSVECEQGGDILVDAATTWSSWTRRSPLLGVNKEVACWSMLLYSGPGGLDIYPY